MRDHATLQSQLKEALSSLPSRFLQQLILVKLSDKGITVTNRQAGDVAQQLLRVDSDGTFKLSSAKFRGRDQNISIEFTKDDADTIQNKFDNFIASDLGPLITEVAQKLSRRLVRSLKREWSKQSHPLASTRVAFERRIKKRWGRALDMSEMYLRLVEEFGSDVNEFARAEIDAGPHKIDALTRLHARSCLVATEVLTLLRAGLADGAMSRWRALHEIAVTINFIADDEEDLAERYIEHRDSRQAGAEEYQQHCGRLNLEPLTDGELTEILAVAEGLKSRFDASFANRYGWAAKKLHKKSPTFKDIEERTQMDHLRPYFRFASNSVHANAHGLYSQLGLLAGGPDVLLTGPSNAGLADPGAATAVSLLQTSAALLRLCNNLDRQVELHAMMQISNEVSAAFYDAHARLERDHEKSMSRSSDDTSDGELNKPTGDTETPAR